MGAELMGTTPMMPIESDYESVEDVIQSLVTLEQVFRQGRDRRAIFATAYLVITKALKRRVDEGGFQDSAWVARYAVCFGNLYREALSAFERGDLESVPKAWRLSFETSVNGTGLVIQDLVLGINAHINHDLALALAEVGIDPNRPERHQDHTAVNLVLRATTDALQDRIGEMYAPILDLLDRATGSLDEALANFKVTKARENAWVAAVSLTNAQDEQESGVIRQNLNDRAAILARLILSPNLFYPWLLGALRHLENVTPWWTLLTVADTERRMAVAARI